MGWDTVRADWPRYVGQVRIRWGKLTEEELKEINGRREVLVEMIQRKYRVPEMHADEDVKIFEKRFDKQAHH
ncbi:MAG: general stress protein CsbD [Nitrococcus sp.]|nr:general stress protein CsbD [Nitrococcus sp.]